MALALERPLGPASVRPDAPGADEQDARLELAVVFTSAEATAGALRKAGALAERLNARIALVVPQVVPYPLPLTSPPVLLDFNERRFSALARESKVETTVRLFLCRDQWVALQTALNPRCPVVLGGRKTWWPSKATRLARRLRRAGYEVILAESE